MNPLSVGLPGREKSSVTSLAYSPPSTTGAAAASAAPAPACASAVRYAEVFSLNNDFHEVLYRAAGNQQLADAILHYTFATHPIRTRAFPSEELREIAIGQHFDMIDAIARGAPEELADIIRKHIQGPDEGNHRLNGRSSSAAAKHADAFFRISLAVRSPQLSRSNSLIRSFSALVRPPLTGVAVGLLAPDQKTVGRTAKIRRNRLVGGRIAAVICAVLSKQPITALAQLGWIGGG